MFKWLWKKKTTPTQLMPTEHCITCAQYMLARVMYNAAVKRLPQCDNCIEKAMSEVWNDLDEILSKEIESLRARKEILGFNYDT